MDGETDTHFIFCICEMVYYLSEQKKILTSKYLKVGKETNEQTNLSVCWNLLLFI